MKRPNLVNFFPILTDKCLSIRANITLIKAKFTNNDQNDDLNRSPIGSLRQLLSNQFTIKVNFIDHDKKIFRKKYFESDQLGNIYLKYPLSENQIKSLYAIEVFEISYHKGIEFYLGTFFPVKLKESKKIIICDFDKTLVDTKYSNTKEIYKSLTSPIQRFPKVQKSIDILHGRIKEDFQPFILSASPHFYVDAIRDWLYQNSIYTAGIFLKDFRKILSIFDHDLTFKDLSGQGAYKLSQLLTIIEFVDIPKELVLMGDNYESDPIIYIILSRFLHGKTTAPELLKKLKDRPEFILNRKQQTLLLNKLYRVEDKLKRVDKQNQIKIKILIRKYQKTNLNILDRDLNDSVDLIDCYDT